MQLSFLHLVTITRTAINAHNAKPEYFHTALNLFTNNLFLYTPVYNYIILMHRTVEKFIQFQLIQ